MNAPSPLPASSAAGAYSLPVLSAARAAPILSAAEILLPHLARGHRVTSPLLRSTMEAAFGGSDAEGAWIRREAYEACEATQVLFLRKYGPAMRRQTSSLAARLAMLTRLASLLPTQTRRSEESQAFQQFSTPIGLGFCASVAAGITGEDIVLEPSAGKGLLAIFAEAAGATITLNEFAASRADLLELLFPERG